MPTRIHAALYNNHDDARSRDTRTPADHGHDRSATAASPRSAAPALNYAKVIVSLADILADYDLRTGNYALFAARAAPSANAVDMRLDRGTLTLDLPRDVYQRAGLTFPATRVGSGAKKHESASARFRVEIDLRAEGMVSGRKGFERLLRASASVDGLKEARVWLFCEVGGRAARKRKRGEQEEGGAGRRIVEDATGQASSATVSSAATVGHEMERDHPLARHHPTVVVETGALTTRQDVLVPGVVSCPEYLSSLSSRNSASASKAEIALGTGCLPALLDDDIHELVEYLGLLCLGSPRITKRDYGRIDPYLCRYVLPTAGTALNSTGKAADVGLGDERSEDGEVGEDGGRDAGEGVEVEDVTTVRYSGFMTAEFVMRLVVDVIRRSRVASSGDGPAWMAINVDAFQTEAKGGIDGYLILLQGGETADGIPRDVMDVDVGDLERRHNSDERLAEKQSQEAKGLRYVTCFEFVDSMTR